MKKLFSPLVKSLALVSAVGGFVVVSNQMASASEKYDLYWTYSNPVEEYVDYEKKVSHDAIEWTVTFNKYHRAWVNPTYTVFLPSEVKDPTDITITRENAHRKIVDTKKVSHTKWSTHFTSNRWQFEKEWDKYPGYTAYSPALGHFTDLKNEGKFDAVLIEGDGGDFTQYNDKLVWKFKTELKDQFKGQGDKTAFLAGIRQHVRWGDKSHPNFRGEFGED
ncbi:hypothetical protein ACVRY7_03300 [Streptococcus ictaluri]|uniref:Uncharacterized protein n=1 Tax=Streptococcus ictaluri 707-05 TaxID=764299 RepID=G5K1C4_9STRE|nr:hypothetical protein [Streptococcus ictaluri]EHI70233.1 hypothetical protein STRIC_2181 [Streptococcus ictaluri 707-05]